VKIFPHPASASASRCKARFWSTVDLILAVSGRLYFVPAWLRYGIVIGIPILIVPCFEWAARRRVFDSWFD
jgi:hypothetical protein